MQQPTLNANKTSSSQSRNDKNCTKTEDSTPNYQNVKEHKILKLKPPQVLIPHTHTIYIYI